ncbi:hypothetical protein [Pelagicoccus albus]|uniref:UDP-2,4-diacetamido-2,4,6-trideoxy-beta-L-altropyranose hydrolase n=1 Tax=Pelagicoccus albus TaxID=415222 RepID=A0A7X1B526_9BACT|nr:hypothetical protein [Pelagicoccus albus]MBC2605783.1 hypothetical protein [Pelagicoccus albus]
MASEFQSRGWATLLWGEGDFDALPEDVRETFSGVAGSDSMADVLFIDEMYTPQTELAEVAEKWRTTNAGGVVGATDDMGNRSMAGFDFVVNSEIGLTKASYEAGTSLLGEDYALVRAAFRPKLIEKMDPFGSDSKRVLVMLGGTDPFGYLPQVMTALSKVSTCELSPVVVTNEPRHAEIFRSSFSDLRVLSKLNASEVAWWMSHCDLGVFACGSSLFEAAATRLPFVGLSVVDNQMATAKKVERYWKQPICYCGDGEPVVDELAQKLELALCTERKVYSKIDAMGCSRVCDVVLSLHRHKCTE